MLSMTLKKNEYVQIGPDVTVYNNEDHQIDIVIHAPRDIQIIRMPDKRDRKPSN